MDSSKSKVGLYESIVTESLQSELEALDSASVIVKKLKLHPAEVSDRLALHLGKVVERALSNVSEQERIEVGIRLVSELVAKISSTIAKSDVSGDQPIATDQFLSSILGFNPDGSVAFINRPLTPLLDTILLTNSPGEPRVGSQITTEIESADRIDVVMAFIRRSGIRPFIENLKRHCQRAAVQPSLRVLTTTYTGSTELEALVLLQELGAEVKVSYDTTTARLHAKAWNFHRVSGASTAYIGSSNLTHSAQVTGMEWNVRISGLRNPDVIRKMNSVFDAYWTGGDFRTFDRDEFAKETERTQTSGPTIMLSPIELRLEPFQERLLEQIEVGRRQGHHRNLLVAATGTGKTVMAAIDYARLRETLPRARLLFVAHRQEILDQSLATFRYALREPSFGEKWVGQHKPTNFEYVFASIQSLNAAGFSKLAADHFDVVIVDEFHHAAAPSYKNLLSHVLPIELLGLTATPERTDGLSILDWFDGRIAAELRLWDAIDQHRLVPFSYYGIHDGLDLRGLPWRRRSSYDINELSNLYTSNDAWARLVIKEVGKRVDDPLEMKALGFCVSIKHAQFMAQHFANAGIASAAVWGDTPEAERREALRMLSDGKIQILFSVDLFNEGIDIPSVDTLLLLRPTESATLFLQQLGRGLRKSKHKLVCTVLDFVGLHRREFRFDRRLSALLGGSRKYLQSQVENAFPYLPAGCHMELDAVASRIVLDSLKSALPHRWNDKVNELRGMIAGGFDPTIETYIEETGLSLTDVYAAKKSWSDYLEAVNITMLPPGPDEPTLRRAIGRMLHIDDEERLDFYQRIVAETKLPNLTGFSVREQRMYRMLVASMCDQILKKDMSLAQGGKLLWQHPQVLAELHELFAFLRMHIDHVHQPIGTHDNVPLQVHGKYTRIEILAAFGVGDTAKTRPWQEGVLWVGGEKSDLCAFTLDKSSGSFSPTTRYRDYAISRERIHWETQSKVRADSTTGMRYRNHVQQGSAVMLFARESTDERAFWFLGPATYVSHDSERPMGITWQLDVSLPGDLYATFAAAVA
ncbi:MAG: superfamily II DNA or RNA helicase/HKD family nuclease [Candidatus Azotimanducaceae bacterium]|jgi:superfamily II DNA or RNA helicase/HKD family nuclease